MTRAEQGAALCVLARGSVAAALGGPEPARPAGAWAREPGASFVTLRREGGELQGCIGSLEARRGLAEDVAANARAAALGDPRGGRLDLADVAGLGVEVSLLSALARVAAASEAEATAALRAGVDGVVLIYGRRRGTFLPQVWDALPEPKAFLAALRRKAGLPADFWALELEVWRYTVEKFVNPGATS